VTPSMGPSIYDVHTDGGKEVQPEVDACGQGEERGQSHYLIRIENRHCISETVFFCFQLKIKGTGRKKSPTWKGSMYMFC